MLTLTPILLAGTLALTAGLAFAGDLSCSARSGKTTAAFVELYTSEGCSSCPPAETWLASLAQRYRVPEQVVPLAWHVDYWNDLGWVDPYAQSRFTERQSRWAFLNRTNTIYTPQILMNGEALIRWQHQGDAVVPRLNAVPARADISLDLARGADQVTVTAQARARDRSGRPELYVAVYERNLVRHIQGGENSGRTLHHDYVVRELIGPQALDESGAARVNAQVKFGRDWKSTDLGVAAFVQAHETGEVRQALALPLCR